METNNRLISLDIFRGITIASMILVNNPGDYHHEYNLFKHAEWNGLTFTDIIFPAFLFIMGVSIVFALQKFKIKSRRGIPTNKILKRTIILFLLGLFVNLLIYPSVGGFRIAGVLQRIAITYLLCSLLFLYVNKRGLYAIAFLLLGAYYMLLKFIPAPGLEVVSLDQGKNIVSWFDIQYLPGMLYAENHDPEGILSTISALVNVLFGIQAGMLLKQFRNDKTELLKRLGILGGVLIILGLLWSFYIPINKNLWTSSFTLVTSGISVALLGLSYYLFDFLKIKKGTLPFEVFGKNAIVSYVLSFILLYLVYPPFFGKNGALINITYEFFRSFGLSENLSSLCWALIYTFFCFIPVYILFRKGIFIKV